jgi:hypothetical protein
MRQRHGTTSWHDVMPKHCRAYVQNLLPQVTNRPPAFATTGLRSAFQAFKQLGDMIRPLLGFTLFVPLVFQL